jgi:ABC-type nickel/cobalt efflux system permease component RcnA
MPFLSRASLTAVLILAGILAVAVLRPRSADAHPLGNFTVNHFTRIEVSETGIELYRVLDLAELPALQERQRIDTDDDGAVSGAESAAYVAEKASSIRSAFTLRMNGEETRLDLASSALTFPDGEAGLSLLRLALTYTAPLPEGWRDATPRVEFEDRNDVGRPGWREVVVRAGMGIELPQSTAPATDITHELTSYPEGSLSSPLDVRTASFSFRPGFGTAGPTAHPKQDQAVRGNRDGTLSRFTDLLANEDLSAGVIALSLLAAVAFGAYHALTPGHGKTVVAAYLVGSRGTARHALLLGLVVTATHTSSVYIFGFVALYLSQFILPEDLYPWLGICSGILILTMGTSLLIARLRASGVLRGARRWAREHVPQLVIRQPALALAEAAPLARGSTRAINLTSGVDAATTGIGPRGHLNGAHSHEDRGHTHHQHDAPADHSHSHGFGDVHTHRIPGQDGRPVTIRSLIGLGVFGGMIPCPSAIVVMLGAIALHRVAFGLLLIVAFSVGLAGVLVAIGFALVYAGAISERVPIARALRSRIDGRIVGTAARLVPVASALAVVVAGLLITARALAQQGVI